VSHVSLTDESDSSRSGRRVQESSLSTDGFFVERVLIGRIGRILIILSNVSPG